MAFDRDIGSVSIDVTTDEAALKAKIKAAFASVGPLHVKLIVDTEEIGDANAALKTEAKKTQSELTAIEKKGREDRKRDRERENAAEIKSQKDHLRRIEANKQKSDQQILLQQEKDAGRERRILEERVTEAQKAQSEINLVEAKGLDKRRAKFQTYVAAEKKAAADLAAFEVRTTAAKNAEIEKIEKRRVAQAEKDAAALTIIEKRQSEAIRADKAKLATDLERIDKAGKERQQRNQFVFNARELAAQRAHARSLELISARSFGKIASFSNKPIGLGILGGLTKINSSLVEFDRVASRVLRTSLLSFTAWSAGVAAAAGAAATAAIVSFAKFEQAVARASAVFASDIFTKNLVENGQNIKTFAQLATESSAAVVKASNAVALTTLFNPREVAEGARALAQAGLTQREALDKTASGYSNLATVAAFAQNEQLDFAAATEFLTGGLVSAGLEMGQLTDLTDKFTTVANATNASAQQVAEAFSNQGAAAFRAYGQSAEQALTVIGLLAKANERGLKAGTTAAILIREINNAAVNKAPEAFKKYGIAVGKVNGQTVPFTKTLTQLTTLFRDTEKREGSQGFARLRKELGLTEKSLRGLILLTPQVATLGQEGVDRFTGIIQKSAGATQRQASVVTKTLSFQFQNLIESITIQFQHFGEEAGKSLAAVFDRFNGPDGIIKSLEPDVLRLGRRFGELIDRFGKFVDSPEAREGALIILDALKITLIGVRDSFKAFASAFGEVENGQSAFVAFAKSVRAFAEVSATSLPIVAKILGEIISLLIDNKDSFELFAKAAVGLFVMRRAFALTIVPVKALTEGFIDARKAATALAVSSESGAIASGLGALATKIGFVDKSAIAARDSLVALQAASAFSGSAAAPASAATASTLAANASAKKGFGKLAIAESTALPAVTQNLSKASQALSKATGAFGDFAIAGSKAVAVVGAIILAFEAVFDSAKGFSEGLKETTESSEDAKRGLDFLKTAAKKTIEVLRKGLPIVIDILELTVETIGLVAKTFGRLFGDMLGTAVKFTDAFGKLIKGDLTGFLKDFASGIFDLLVKPVKESLLFLLEAVQNTLDKVVKLPGIGGKFKDDKKGIDEAIESLKGFGVETKKVSDTTVELHGRTENVFSKLNDRLKTSAENTKKLVAEQRDYAKAINESTFASEFNKITTGAEKSTQSQIDFYKKLLDGSKESEKQIKLLGLSRAEVQRKLYLSEQDQVKALTKGPLTDLQKAYKALNKNGNITPRFNRAALNTIDASIRAFQQEKRDIRALDLPKDQERKLIGQANAAIAKLREAVEKRPVIVRFKLAGETVRGFANKDDLIAGFLGTSDVPGAIRRAIDNPQLVKVLSDSQRAVLEKARADAESKGAGGNRDFILTSVAEQLNAAEPSKSDSLRIKKTALMLGADVATGLAQGAEATSPLVQKAAVENANAYLFGLNSVFKFGSPSKTAIQQGRMVSEGLAIGIRVFATLPMAAAYQAGIQVMHMYALGLTVGGAEVRAAALDVIRSTSTIISGVGYSLAVSAGTRYMVGLKDGMNSYFEATIKPFLHEYIPKRIAELKGPVAYDATILVPAGEAVMHGFDQGLRRGFGGVENFLKDVGPSMEEFVPDSLFADRTKKFMVDVAMGKSPDPYDFYKDLIPETFFGGFSGILDPTLGFLHKTLSLADTADMAGHLAKLFNLQITALRDDHSRYTSSGNLSDHGFGIAADLSNGTDTPQEAALFAAVSPLIGKVFKQLIHQHTLLDYSRGKEYYASDDHKNHVHLAWLMGKGFSADSGKKGEPIGSTLNIPGVPADVLDAISFAASKTHLPQQLIAAVMKQESGFRKDVVSFDGGYGLMQLTSQNLVDAADRIGGRFNPRANALIGAEYLSDLISQLGSVQLGLSAYNSGPGGGESSGHVDVPSYVNSVLGFLNEFKKKFGGFREHGGPVDANRPYIVGERGPELMFPRTSGTIVNHRDTAAMMNGQMGKVYNDNRQITLQTNSTDPAAILGYLRAHTRDDLATLAGM